MISQKVLHQTAQSIFFDYVLLKGATYLDFLKMSVYCVYSFKNSLHCFVLYNKMLIVVGSRFTFSTRKEQIDDNI